MQTQGDVDREESEDSPTVESIALSSIGYVPMLFLLPWLLGRSDGYCRFHARQSLILFAAFILVWLAILVSDVVLGRMLGSILLLGVLFEGLAWLVHNIVGGLVSLTYIALIVACIVQASLGRRWRIPVLGGYAERLGFLA